MMKLHVITGIPLDKTKAVHDQLRISGSSSLSGVMSSVVGYVKKSLILHKHILRFYDSFA